MRTLPSTVIALVVFVCCAIGHAEPVPVQVAGVYTHPGFKMLFPERVGSFQRVGITRYTPDEMDVSAGYNLIDYRNPMSVTVFVYPAQELLSIGSPADVVETAKAHQFQGSLESVKHEILKSNASAKLISEADFTLVESDRSHKGRKVVFEMAYNYGFGPLDSISHLYLFQQGTWLIKYRLTFPKRTKDEAEKAIAEFVSSLTWPK